MNAHVCHRCDRMQRPAFTCAESGLPIAEHADSGQCPLNKFSDPLAGDVLAQWANRLGAERFKAWWRKVSGKPCRCDRRVAWINRVHERLKRRLKI